MITQTSSTKMLGLRLSAGLALGAAWVVSHSEASDDGYATQSPEQEKIKFETALASVDADLGKIEERSRQESADQAEIIATHRLLLQDPEWQEQITQKILNEKVAAPVAVQQVTTEFSDSMAALDDAYLRERAHDIRDVGQRVINKLLGKKETVLLPEQGEYIIVTKDLTPSQFASLDKKRVLGLVTEQGGVTSHTAIMARLYEIPALSGIENATARIRNHDLLFVEADKSDLHVNPPEELRKVFSDNVLQYHRQKREMLKLAEADSVTLDNVKLYLEANIGRESDLELVQKYKAEGVGLFRTEFLFFDRPQAPSENEQFETYRKVGQALHPHPVVVRTFDIGADKQVPYLKWPKEENPFLGLRALRYCLKSPELFHTQLRALFRASHYTPLSIMFPMVSSIEELEGAKEHVELCKKQILDEGLKPQYKLGIMIEVPSAALIADQLAQMVDFFSIGTNDLIQYVCAVDRMNESVAHLYESFHPGVLNLIAQVIAAANKHDTGVTMCGEMAADLDLIPLLVGMGLRTFSQSPATVLRSKNLIRKLKASDCEALWKEAKTCGTAHAIQNLCLEFKKSLA